MVRCTAKVREIPLLLRSALQSVKPACRVSTSCAPSSEAGHSSQFSFHANSCWRAWSAVFPAQVVTIARRRDERPTVLPVCPQRVDSPRTDSPRPRRMTPRRIPAFRVSCVCVATHRTALRAQRPLAGASFGGGLPRWPGALARCGCRLPARLQPRDSTPRLSEGTRAPTGRSRCPSSL